MSNTMQYILCTFENITRKRLAHTQTENILTLFFMASAIAAVSRTAATEHGLSKLPPGVTEKSIEPSCPSQNNNVHGEKTSKA